MDPRIIILDNVEFAEKASDELCISLSKYYFYEENTFTAWLFVEKFAVWLQYVIYSVQ